VLESLALNVPELGKLSQAVEQVALPQVVCIHALLMHLAVLDVSILGYGALLGHRSQEVDHLVADVDSVVRSKGIAAEAFQFEGRENDGLQDRFLPGCIGEPCHHFTRLLLVGVCDAGYHAGMH
jgi:hypothetical protein